MVYRFFCLQSHYRKSLVFSWENLDNATVAFGKLIAKIAALDPGDGLVDEAAAAELKEKFSKAMDNDLNTSMAVTVLYDVLKAKTNGATKLAPLWTDFDSVLGLKLLEKAADQRKTQAAAAQPPAASPWSARTARRMPPGGGPDPGPGRRQEGQKLRRGRPHPSSKPAAFFFLRTHCASGPHGGIIKRQISTEKGEIHMQAIILAAGMGKRLKELTQDRTKCMVQVNGGGPDRPDAPSDRKPPSVPHRHRGGL